MGEYTVVINKISDELLEQQDPVGYVAAHIYAAARRIIETHNKSGRLLNSLMLKRISINEIIIYNDLQLAPYAKYVHDGTKPHIIEPKRASVLRWMDDNGEVHFAKRVKHPGYVGDPWFERAINEVQSLLE